MLIPFEALHVEAWGPKFVFAADFLIQSSLLPAPVSWALKWSCSLNSFCTATFVQVPCVVEHLKFKLCHFRGGLNLGWILLPLFRTWTHVAKKVLTKVSARILLLSQQNEPSWHTDKVTLPCSQERKLSYKVWNRLMLLCVLWLKFLWCLKINLRISLTKQKTMLVLP